MPHLLQALVPVLGGGPDGVLDGLVDVVLAVRLGGRAFLGTETTLK